jgi:hypothetical protein
MSERDNDGDSWSWSKLRFWVMLAIIVMQLNSCMDWRELRDLQRRVGQLEERVK